MAINIPARFREGFSPAVVLLLMAFLHTGFHSDRDTTIGNGFDQQKRSPVILNALYRETVM